MDLMLQVMKLAEFVNERLGEYLRETFTDAIQFYLRENKEDFPGGEIVKFCLLAFLMCIEDRYIKAEYDPTCCFKLDFDFEYNE